MPEEPNNGTSPQENDVVPDVQPEMTTPIEPTNNTDPLETLESPAPASNDEPAVASVGNVSATPVAVPLESPSTPASLSDAPVASDPFGPSAQPEATAPDATPVIAATPVTFGSGPTQPGFEPTPPKKRKKAFIIGAIVAGAAALLIGGGALAYNLWYQNPNKVVSDAIVNAITAKTISATGVLEVETDDYKLKVEASGKNSLEAHSNVAVKVTYSADDVNFVVDGEGVYSAEGDIYVKLKDARKLADSIEEQSNGDVSFEVFDGVINKVDGKWIKIGKEDLGDVSEEYEKSQKCVADISKQLEEDASFRKTVEKETENLYKSHPFIVVGDKLGSRTINGAGSLGYKLTGDEKVADEFFTSFGDSQLGKKFKDCNKDIDFSNIFNESTDKEDKSTGTTEAEIWVSRFGHSITEVNLKGEDDGSKGSLVLNPVFNKNEKVEIPSDTIPFTELQKDIEKAYEEYYQSYYDDYYSNASGTSTEFN